MKSEKDFFMTLGQGVTTALIQEWMLWQQRKQRPENYVWSLSDIKAFIDEIAADTPEKIRAEVRAETGAASGN